MIVKRTFLITVLSLILLISAPSILDKAIPAFSQTTGENQSEINYEFVTKWGTLGSEIGQLDGQNDVISSGDSIYVADYYNERIQKFTPDGEFVKMWGGTYGEADGEFKKPHGVAVDSEGNVYVSERSGLRIQKFDSEGNFITKWGSPGTGDGQFTHLHDIAVGPGGSGDQTTSITNNETTATNNEYVYVTDAENFNVQKFTTDGEFVTKWGSEGTGNGQFGGLESVDIDSEGNVYVADSGNDKIQKFTTDGEFILSWGERGSGPGQFNDPGGVGVDNDDNIYITDIRNNRVQVFTPEGQFISQIGLAGTGENGDNNESEIISPAGSSPIDSCCIEGDNDGQFNRPEGIDVGPDNRVIVADTGNNRIQIFERIPVL
jgi:sugar lactone lactonase YvrE